MVEGRPCYWGRERKQQGRGLVPLLVIEIGLGKMTDAVEGREGGTLRGGHVVKRDR